MSGGGSLVQRPSLAEWQLAPFNRWSFWHVRELIPTERISRGNGPVVELPHEERDVLSTPFEHAGRAYTVGSMLEESFTDAFLVVHRGAVVHEWYAHEGGPDQPHLLMSVSKSLTSALVGALADRGLLDPETTVTDVVAELRGTSFEGATIQHLLDMRTGTRFAEDYDDPTSDAPVLDRVAGWAPANGEEPAELHAYIASLENDQEHGGAFRYRSVLTDLLGWVVEEAGLARFAELFSREIWSKLGCEQDADITLDPGGHPFTDGGICTTARDLARFGSLYLGRGELAGRRVLSDGWVQRILTPNAELVEAFEGAPDIALMPGGFYHDCWWIRDANGIYAGEGIHGQLVYVHSPSETVVVKFSTWPRAWMDEMAALTEAGVAAMCQALPG